MATIFAYLALRSPDRSKKLKLARIADLLFLFSLCCTGAVALFMTFALAG
jgi:hypothetical protein